MKLVYYIVSTVSILIFGLFITTLINELLYNLNNCKDRHRGKMTTDKLIKSILRVGGYLMKPI